MNNSEIILIIGEIIGLCVIIGIYLRKGKPTKVSLKGNLKKPLYWYLLTDLDQQNTCAPWEDILSLKLADPNDIAPYLHNDIYVIQGGFDTSSESRSTEEYKVEDLLFVHWRSPQKSWDHLAGREGYVVISKSEKRQIDFIMTRVS
ncbi:hypothetical protein [Pedobacter agri]|uniref:hypothetical protein n=1 Tax=Pedobacter agri TaxID=454586 RepID=UPI00292E1E59|nr:hypothetical protein [Pedobacter agri]